MWVDNHDKYYDKSSSPMMVFTPWESMINDQWPLSSMVVITQWWSPPSDGHHPWVLALFMEWQQSVSFARRRLLSPSVSHQRWYSSPMWIITQWVSSLMTVPSSECHHPVSVHRCRWVQLIPVLATTEWYSSPSIPNDHENHHPMPFTTQCHMDTLWESMFLAAPLWVSVSDCVSRC